MELFFVKKSFCSNTFKIQYCRLKGVFLPLEYNKKCIGSQIPAMTKEMYLLTRTIRRKIRINHGPLKVLQKSSQLSFFKLNNSQEKIGERFFLRIMHLQ